MSINTPNRHKLFVDTFFTSAEKGNQNRKSRIKEITRSAEKVEHVHGKIPRLGFILRELPQSLFHAYEPKRDSFGYKETAEMLKETINRVMNKPIFIMNKK